MRKFNSKSAIPIHPEQEEFREKAIQKVKTLVKLQKQLEFKMHDILAVSRCFNARTYVQAFLKARMVLPESKWLQDHNPDEMSEIDYKMASSRALLGMQIQYQDMAKEVDDHLNKMIRAQFML